METNQNRVDSFEWMLRAHAGARQITHRGARINRIRLLDAFDETPDTLRAIIEWASSLPRRLQGRASFRGPNWCQAGARVYGVWKNTCRRGEEDGFVDIDANGRLIGVMAYGIRRDFVVAMAHDYIERVDASEHPLVPPLAIEQWRRTRTEMMNAAEVEQRFVLRSRA